MYVTPLLTQVIEMLSGKPPWSEQNFENPFRALYHIGHSTNLPKIPDTVSDLGRSVLPARSRPAPHAVPRTRM